ncbi:hypothetical protein [Bacillus sp. CHD6a]|uniref:hypothetical protein n=1 Tax=Bacillus sp. CHD6a TaxID=1643452 RepID=UPI0006CC2554|nr:hypothetical protein [Bacillus sp. CHD6a]KPB04915.1 hypothetical protein AAV98_09380 [Bacillus sp. CHD6a]
MRRFKDISGQSPLQSVWQSEMLNELKLAVGHRGTREEFIHLLRWDRSYRDHVEGFLEDECTYAFDHPDWNTAEPILSIGEMKRSF